MRDESERSTTTYAQRRKIFIDLISEGDAWRSTKIECLLRDLKTRLKESGGKILIFSTYSCVLDIVSVALGKQNILKLRFDGSLTSNQKQEFLSKFASPDGPRVMLITAGSGSEGLNLQQATTVMIITPFWAPSTGEQCISRAWRIGQREVVYIFTYFAQNSIDEMYKERSELKRNKQVALYDTFISCGISKKGSRRRAAIALEVEKIKRYNKVTFFEEVRLLPQKLINEIIN